MVLSSSAGPQKKQQRRLRENAVDSRIFNVRLQQLAWSQNDLIDEAYNCLSTARKNHGKYFEKFKDGEIPRLSTGDISDMRTGKPKVAYKIIMVAEAFGLDYWRDLIITEHKIDEDLKAAVSEVTDLISGFHFQDEFYAEKDDDKDCLLDCIHSLEDRRYNGDKNHASRIIKKLDLKPSQWETVCKALNRYLVLPIDGKYRYCRPGTPEMLSISWDRNVINKLAVSKHYGCHGKDHLRFLASRSIKEIYDQMEKKQKSSIEYTKLDGTWPLELACATSFEHTFDHVEITIRYLSRGIRFLISSHKRPELLDYFRGPFFGSFEEWWHRFSTLNSDLVFGIVECLLDKEGKNEKQIHSILDAMNGFTRANIMELSNALEMFRNGGTRRTNQYDDEALELFWESHKKATPYFKKAKTLHFKR